MRVLMFVLLAAGCGATTPATDLEALNRRVTSLERRLNEMEQGKSAKGKPAAAPGAEGDDAAGEAPAAPVVKVEVKAEGDAKKVVVKKGKRPFQVPGQVPIGDATIWASFEEGVDPTEVAKIKLEEGKPLTITCSSADKTCKPKP
jgi:hypothetical protein